MGRMKLEMPANFLVALYLVTHGVPVPREDQADLVSGFCYSILASLKSELSRLSAFFRLGGRPLQA